MKFYRCKHCGSIVVKIAEGNVVSPCCSDVLTELIPNTSEGAREKHLPVVERNVDKVYVRVSSVQHPSTDAHYIQAVVLETPDGFKVKQLKAGDVPSAEFVLSAGETPVAAYEHCNLHGLWKTDLA